VILRWVLALVLAMAAGIGVLWSLTDGFSALTAEAARRQSVARQPRAIPDVRVLDASGRIQSLDANLHDDGRVAIVNFFYTRCVSLCLAQGSLTGQMQQVIEAEGLQDKVRLLSVSFDPRDKADDLARYATRMHAQGDVWQFMSFDDPRQMQAALDLFGITVIPAPLGEFEHNAAFHVVTPDGRLARIFDLDAPGLALQAAQDLAGTAGAGS